MQREGPGQPEEARELDLGSLIAPISDDVSIVDRAREPLRWTVWESVQFHWVTALIPFLLVLGAAVAIGLIRSPVYTAESRLQVQLAASTPAGLPGTASAGQEYAQTYARAIDANEIVKPVAKATGVRTDEIIESVTATQVPESSVLTVSADASTGARATALANATSAAVEDYSRAVEGTTIRSDRFLQGYETAAQRYEESRRRKLLAEQAFNRSSTGSNQAALDAAAVDAQTAFLRRESLQQSYQASRQLFTAPLDVISTARAAESDQVPRLQLLIFLGLLAGLATGAALATARANLGW